MNENNKKKNYIGFVPLFFILIALMLSCLYFLPEQIGKLPLKRVDMLSSLRGSKEADLDNLTDSLLAQIDIHISHIENDTAVKVNPVDQLDSLQLQAYRDSLLLVSRDSLYREMIMAYADADTSLTSREDSFIPIEDFSVGKKGLEYFFSQLRNRNSLNRPIYIAFLGDSFIEGDIFVADFRNELQQLYGGKGVGFVPVTSKVNKYRPTVKHDFYGWESYSILHNKKHKYTLPGEVASPGKGALLSYANSNRYSTLSPVSKFKLFYQNADSVSAQFVFNKKTAGDTIQTELANTHTIKEFVYSGTIVSADIKIESAKNLEVVGASFEGNSGVVVDNFSLRGNSGLILSELDKDMSESFNKLRPYDLIIIQYGLNVVSEKMLNYNWYAINMKKVIASLKEKFPQSDFLIMGVTDRAQQSSSGLGTMPAVVALLTAQKQLAKEMNIPFWNTFMAMGGKDSMVDFAEKGWAAKDYTHITFAGGKKLAKKLVQSFEKEKEFYDEASKIND